MLGQIDHNNPLNIFMRFSNGPCFTQARPRRINGTLHNRLIRYYGIIMHINNRLLFANTQKSYGKSPIPPLAASMAFYAFVLARLNIYAFTLKTCSWSNNIPNIMTVLVGWSWLGREQCIAFSLKNWGYIFCLFFSLLTLLWDGVDSTPYLRFLLVIFLFIDIFTIPLVRIRGIVLAIRIWTKLWRLFLVRGLGVVRGSLDLMSQKIGRFYTPKNMKNFIFLRCSFWWIW